MSDEGPSYIVPRARTPQSARFAQNTSLRSVLLTAAVISALLLISAFFPYAPAIVITALAVWSLTGTKQAIQALSLVVVIKFLNPAIYHFAGPFALLAWVAVAGAGARMFYDNMRSRSGTHPAIPWLLVFSFVVLVQSVFFSSHPTVSIFKMLSFTFTAAAILVGFKVTAVKSVDWTAWFVGLWLAVLILSASTWFFPGIAFYVNGRGFQGILAHPQILGTFLAPMVAWVSAKTMLSPSKGNYWLYVVLPAAWGLMLMTRARTALIAVAAGFLAVLIVALCRWPEWRTQVRKAVLRPASIIIVLALIVIALLRPGLIEENSAEFINKGGEESTSIEDSFEHSRGNSIRSQLLNFIDYPVFGIGFGVSLDPSFEPLIEPLIGLPLSAPTEKGFLPSAILEETGIVGTTCFLVFLVAFIRQALRKTEIVLAWVFLTSLFVNVGEMVFFSAGGLGLYLWLLFGWATSGSWKTSRGT